mgnify:CR=1 FL=1
MDTTRAPHLPGELGGPALHVGEPLRLFGAGHVVDGEPVLGGVDGALRQSGEADGACIAYACP